MAAGALRQGASSHRGGGGGKEAMPCWASLHTDLTQLIAARVLATGGFVDYIRFRAVCSGWRAAAASPCGRGLLDPRLHPRRWMLFPEGYGQRPGHPAHGGHARFFDLSSAAGAGAGGIVRVPIPELEDHHVLDSPDGLLLLLRFEDTAVRLLHPFTRDVADLPSFHRLAQQVKCLNEELPDRVRVRRLDADVFYFYRTLSRELCSAVSITASGTITVMLALAPIGRVAVASAGDDEWTISSWAWEEDELKATLPYQGKLYVVNQKGGLIHVSRIDPPLRWCDEDVSLSPPAVPPPRTVATVSSMEIYLPSLVELDSEIMLAGYKNRACSCILVLKLADLVLGRTVPVTCIGDHVLFTGASSFAGARCLCVSSNWLPSIGRNSIIRVRWNCLAQYNINSGAWFPASDEDTCFEPPKPPCELVHHIFTCCYRRFWNTGLLFQFGAWIPDWRARLPGWTR